MNLSGQQLGERGHTGCGASAWTARPERRPRSPLPAGKSTEDHLVGGGQRVMARVRGLRAGLRVSAHHWTGGGRAAAPRRTGIFPSGTNWRTEATGSWRECVDCVPDFAPPSALIFPAPSVREHGGGRNIRGKQFGGRGRWGYGASAWTACRALRLRPPFSRRTVGRAAFKGSISIGNQLVDGGDGVMARVRGLRAGLCTSAHHWPEGASSGAGGSAP
jgi:hypothetical protein